MPLATVILAAGMGKRMNDPTKPKVLFEIHGKPMLEYVIERAIEIGSEKIVIIAGFHRQQVIDFVEKRFAHLSSIEFAIQEEQLWTGHAVAQARNALADFHGDIVILSWDVPLLQARTLEQFRDFHTEGDYMASLISCKLENPLGYGRILRDPENAFIAIKEQKDASETERLVQEINSGIYMVRASKLFATLDRIGNENAWGEYYLTDIFGILRADGDAIGAYTIQNPREISGANTIEQLRELEQLTTV